MPDNRKNNGDNLSHEDRVKGGEHSHRSSSQHSKSQNDSGNSPTTSSQNQKNKSGHQITDEERSRGGKNS